ncbi:MAG: hypothetical protein OXI97_12400 [Acidimicrobiaceae bacterium]|nr:hypothetical protein [Acidimicrobiaceae bacterium]
MSAKAWNGRDYYVAFGHSVVHGYKDQWGGWRWDFARRYSLLSGGGGERYWKPLRHLKPGHQVFAHVARAGYVGVGLVTSTPRRLREETVPVDGEERLLIEQPDFVERFALCFADRVNSDNDNINERVVPVKWTVARNIDCAFWEKGLKAYRNTACKLTDQHTIDRVLAEFGLDED